jgi:hypothetical protein
MANNAKDQAKIELAIRELERRYAPQRDDLFEFLKFYRANERKQELDDNRHIRLICKKLEDVFYGRCKRLMINVPPRSLKTEIVSIAFPVWCIGKKQEIKFMDIAYAASLSEESSAKCRIMYNSQTYRKIFPRSLPLREDKNTKQHRENTV